MEPEEQQERETLVLESFKSTLFPALKFGALSGSSGILYGLLAGPIRSKTPGLFTVAAGIEWFALGSTFWATRATILYFRSRTPSPNDTLYASTLAGGFTGGVLGLLIRGPRTILPRTLTLSLFSFAAQSLYTRLDERHTQSLLAPESEGSFTFWRKLAGRKYSPMKVLSDAEYEALLKEKLLAVDAEIALVEEQIVALKTESRETENPKMKENEKK